MGADVSVLSVLLTLAGLTVAYRIHRAHTAPAEDGGSHRKETESSVTSS